MDYLRIFKNQPAYTILFLLGIIFISLHAFNGEWLDVALYSLSAISIALGIVGFSPWCEHRLQYIATASTLSTILAYLVFIRYFL